MSYTTMDFTESLTRVAITKADIANVVAAWGKGDGMGEDAGHYRWAEDGASDWSGGFLMRLKDGRFAYLTGWCDFTGWGCQDGAELYFFDGQPPDAPAAMLAMSALAAAGGDTNAPAPDQWDVEPADLNRWLVKAEEES